MLFIFRNDLQKSFLICFPGHSPLQIRGDGTSEKEQEQRQQPQEQREGEDERGRDGRSVERPVDQVDLQVSLRRPTVSVTDL